MENAFSYSESKTIHLVRPAGVEYLRLNLERFVEFHSDDSWF